MTTSQKDALKALGSYLRPYQRRYLADTSRKKIVLKSRQIGFSEVCAVEVAQEASTTPRRDIYVISQRADDSKDLLRKVLKWLRILKAAGGQVDIASASATRIELKNGARVIALPCTPQAIRGKTGSLYLDEFAFWLQDKEIWTALLPVISSNPDLKLRVISTPEGMGNVYASLWHKGENWSRHRVDVHDAIADGFPVDFEALERDYTSDQLSQEFLCSFDAGSSSYIPPSLIKSGLQTSISGAVERRYLGVDVASSVDLSALVWLTETSEGVRLERVKTYEGKSSPELEQIVNEALEDETLDRCIVDATGEGSGLAQFLRAKHGSRVVAQKITNPWKVQNIISLKKGLEVGSIELIDDPLLRSDLGRLERKVSAANNIIFDIKRRKGLGHGDVFSALTLAWSLTKTSKRLSRPVNNSKPIEAVNLPDVFGGGFGYLNNF